MAARKASIELRDAGNGFVDYFIGERHAGRIAFNPDGTYRKLGWKSQMFKEQARKLCDFNEVPEMLRRKSGRCLGRNQFANYRERFGLRPEEPERVLANGGQWFVDDSGNRYSMNWVTGLFIVH